MKTLVYLTLLTLATTLVFALIGGNIYKSHLEVEKDLIEKASPISGKIDTEFLEKTFGPANE